MKFLFSFFLMTSTAMAQDCYTRISEFQNSEVKLAKTICIEAVELGLDYFGASQATIKLTLDGKAKEVSFGLNNPLKREGDLVNFKLKDLEHFSQGDICSFSVDASINGELVVDKTTKKAILRDIQAQVVESFDSCHSEDRETQVINYNKVK